MDRGWRGLAPTTHGRASNAIKTRAGDKHLHVSSYRPGLDSIIQAMSNLSVKRQRANTYGDAAIISKPPDDYRKIIATFDESNLRDLLLSAAASSPQVAALIVARRNDIVNAEKQRVTDRVQDLKMDLEKKTPATQAHKSNGVKIQIQDL